MSPVVRVRVDLGSVWARFRNQVLGPESGERPMRATIRVEMRTFRVEVIKKYVNRKSNSKEMLARYCC